MEVGGDGSGGGGVMEGGGGWGNCRLGLTSKVGWA